jgi:L,D-peptidoglycan transpeptidase YkuD (ErfK/YbiS/YcfS/YnhG family)
LQSLDCGDMSPLQVRTCPGTPCLYTLGGQVTKPPFLGVAFVGKSSKITGVAHKIILLFVAISAMAIYLYAHHNWRPLPAGTTIDRIVVQKSARNLSIFRAGKRLKTYRVALGRNPVGPKQEEGDMKTPEGIYKIDNRNAQSSFHLALHISYPSDDDNRRIAERGVSAGFDIMIHGIRNGLGWMGAFHRWKDWTVGCIALTDEEIEELCRVTPDGTTIEMRP